MFKEEVDSVNGSLAEVNTKLKWCLWAVDYKVFAQLHPQLKWPKRPEILPPPSLSVEIFHLEIRGDLS